MPCRTRYCSYSRDKENSSVSIILYFHWWISWFCLCFILDCLHLFLPMYRHLPVFFLPFSHNFRLFNPTTCPLILYKFTHICTRTLKFSLHFLVFTVLPNDEGVTINHPCNVPSESGSLAGEWALWCPRSCIVKRTLLRPAQDDPGHRLWWWGELEISVIPTDCFFSSHRGKPEVND